MKHKIMFAILLMGTWALSGDHQWSYHGKTGPDYWAELSAKNKLCGSGQEQSPINIPLDAVVYDQNLDKLNFTYPKQVKITLHHNGHSIQVDKPGGTLTIGKDEYTLLQFHVHTPSEHLLDSVSMPMEVHFVHQSSTGNLAVVGVLVQLGANNKAWNRILASVPQKEGEKQTVDGANLSALLPKLKTTYRYSGSLTTPDCQEGLRWFVMTNPIEMSLKQIQAISSLFIGPTYPNGNRRPIQELNGRKVTTDLR